MKSYHLIFSTKNKHSLNCNFLFFKNVLVASKSTKKYFQKKTKKHFISILKSPHVNKSAQEQFESHIFSKQLSIFSPKNYQQACLIKKVQTNLLSDTNLKIKSVLNKKNKKKLRLKMFNPDSFKLNMSNKILKSQKAVLTKFKKRKMSKLLTLPAQKKVATFLKVLDLYGELT